MTHPVSVSAYMKALRDLQVNHSVRAMLRAHYGMPSHVATMRYLARAAGWDGHKQANLAYGSFAARLARKVKLRPDPVQALGSIAFLGADSVDDRGEFAFRMRPTFVKALEKLQWVSQFGEHAIQDIKYADSLEGGVQFALRKHRQREAQLRERKIVSELRRSADGHLRCQVPRCGFDFQTAYGDLGERYIEVHHLQPLGGRQTGSVTNLSDLLIVCANCHAMIHRDGANRDPKTIIPRRRDK